MSERQIFASMKLKEAKGLDAILAKFTPRSRRAEVSGHEKAVAEKLAALGHITIDNHDGEEWPISLTDIGNAYKAKGGFKSEWKKNMTVHTTFVLGVISAVAATVAAILGIIKIC